MKSVDSEFLRRRVHRWVDDIEHYPLLYSFYYARSEPSDSEYQLFASSLQTHLSGVLLPKGVVSIIAHFLALLLDMLSRFSP